jgi:acid phosphatase
MIRPSAMTCAVVVLLSGCSPAPTEADRWHGITHIVVIFQENHSFDNVYGGWGAVGGQKVDGRVGTSPDKTIQVAQDGTPLRCLLVIDENLASPTPLPTTCTDPDHKAAQSQPPTAQPVSSHFINQPFSIEEFIPPSATTCSTSGASDEVPNGTGQPGGCTSDLVHRFYQEQYQINGGRQNRYVAGSSAVGLTMGYYDTTKLPIYEYLHGPGAPPYKLADNFFQGAHGGSFLNHQFLVAAQPPLFPGADHSGQNTDAACATGTANCDLHSVVDAAGMPNNYPYYTADGGAVHDGMLTVAADAFGACAPSFPGAAPTPAGTLCGDYAINTIQPFTQPFQPGTAIGMRLPLLTGDNIGDALSEKDVSWKWYSGGWDNAAGNNGHDTAHPRGPGWSAGPTGTAIGTCAPPPPAPGEPAGSAMPAAGALFPYCPGTLFQYHHQPFGYFTKYADGSPGRVAHLADEEQFRLDAATRGGLPPVSFVKPYGAENEHPGYASATKGSGHLVDLIKMIVDGPNAANTLIIVTYDEFGGQWDHVSPPGTTDNPGPHDAYGPGTRIPTLLISAGLTSGVLKSQHDTSSILATIEHRFGARPLRQPGGRPARDSQVADLWSAFS